MTTNISERRFSSNTGSNCTISFYIFALWTFILIGRPQDIFPILKPFRPALTFAIITFIATLLKGKAIALNDLFKLKECKKYALFCLVMIIGIPFAYHRHVAFNYIFLIYTSNMLYFYLFIVHVDSFEKLKSIMFTLCLANFLYSMFSLTKGAFSYGRYSFGGMYDPNDLAYFLVSLFPLSIFYFLHNQGIIKTVIAIASVAASIITILLTGSRGGMIGLIAVLVLILFTKVIRAKWAYKITLVIGIIIISISYKDEINIERYLTMMDIGSDYNVSDEFGRYEVWKKGVQLALSNPITGVGVNCFAMAIGYLRESARVIPKWQASHNSYIQVLAEVGLIGFALFISLIIGCLRNFSHCRQTKEREFESLAGLLQIAFIGHLTCAFFLTHAYSLLFTFFLLSL